MQSVIQVERSGSTPVAWQSVGSLVGSVLANVAIEKNSEFGCPKGITKPSKPRSDDLGQ